METGASEWKDSGRPNCVEACQEELRAANHELHGMVVELTVSLRNVERRRKAGPRGSGGR